MPEVNKYLKAVTFHYTTLHHRDILHMTSDTKPTPLSLSFSACNIEKLGLACETIIAYIDCIK